MANELVVNVSADTQELDQGMGKIKGTLLAVGTVAAAAGLAIAAAFGVKLLDTIKDSSSALTTFQVQTGATDKQTKDFGKSINNVYKEGLGESLNDVSIAMSTVKQQSGLLGKDSPKDIEGITKKALVLKKVFGFEVNESIRSAGSMIQNFGIESDEAFDLMAKGMQVGLNKSDDLLDTLNEYSPNFKMIGFNAKDMFQILKNGSESGVFTIDKVADSIKEFGIRSKDASSTSAEAFKQLGFNANTMFQNFAKGGEVGKKSFYDVIAALNKIEDPVKQNTIGVALFGTMFEDAGAKAILNLGKTGNEFDNVKNKVDEINKIQMNDLFSEWEKFKRNLTTDILVPIGTDLIPVLGKLQDALKETKKGLEWAGILDNTNTSMKSLVSKDNQKNLGEMNGLLVNLDSTAKKSTIANDVAAIADVLKTLAKQIEKVTNFYKDLTEWSNNFSFDNINPFKTKPLIQKVDFREEGKQSAQTYLWGFDELQDDATTKSKNFAMLIKNGLKGNPAELLNAGNGVGNSFLMGLNNSGSGAEEAGKNISNKVGAELSKTSTETSQAGINSGEAFRNGLASKQSEIENVSKNIGDKAKKMDKSSESYLWGQWTTSSLANGINSSSENVGNASNEAAKKIKDNLNSIDSRYFGSTIMQNLMDGLSSKMRKLKEVCKGIAQAISDFFPHSPAKEGALRDFPKTGYNLMQQLMSGMESQKLNILKLTSDITHDISNNVVSPQLNNSNAGGKITIPIYLDGKKITEVVAPQMTKMIRMQGGY